VTPVAVTILLIFAELSLLAFGGANAVLPEMRRQIVDVQGWLSTEEFVALYALAQAAPGPNVMFVPLVGWHVAGLAGTLAASLGQFVPSSLLVVVAMRGIERIRSATWYDRLRQGIVPVTVGLVAAGAWSLTEAAVVDAKLALVTAAGAVLMTTTRIHPVWLLACGGAAGILLVQS